MLPRRQVHNYGAPHPTPKMPKKADETAILRFGRGHFLGAGLEPSAHVPAWRETGQPSVGCRCVRAPETVRRAACAARPAASRAPDGRRDTVGIVRIDQQRRSAFVSRAGEPREDEHARIVGILRGDIFLGDEVHPIA
jgi:hypothetical protein